MEPDEYQPLVITIPLPIANGRVNSVISLAADWPLTEDEWNHVMTVLEAMRPGLTLQRQSAPIPPAYRPARDPFVPGPH